jgi:hypothetical protein
MALITLHPTEDGIRRLMTYLRDVEDSPDRDIPDVPLSEAPPDYRKLFEGYLDLIRLALSEAEPWWAGTIAAQRELGLDAEAAIAAAFEARMAGPASYPRVTWILRAFWLECAWRNDAGEAALRVRPETFLLQWLVESGESELVRLIACMPYWPIGLDENGKWC